MLVFLGLAYFTERETPQALHAVSKGAYFCEELCL